MDGIQGTQWDRLLALPSEPLCFQQNITRDRHQIPVALFDVMLERRPDEALIFVRHPLFAMVTRQDGTELG